MKFKTSINVSTAHGGRIGWIVNIRRISSQSEQQWCYMVMSCGHRMPMTLYSLFWCMFGQVGTDSVIISYPAKPSEDSRTSARPLTAGAGRIPGDGATRIVETVGLMLFALYHVTAIIVLVNMLIAMMSHSFEDIQVSASHSHCLGYTSHRFRVC